MDVRAGDLWPGHSTRQASGGRAIEVRRRLDGTSASLATQTKESGIPLRAGDVPHADPCP